MNMKALLQSRIGRLRILGFLEGITLIFLVFVAVPMKYGFDNPWGSKIVGPIHGALFLLFVFNAISLGVEKGWKFWKTASTIFIASFIPFGSFYIDKTVLSKIVD